MDNKFETPLLDDLTIYIGDSVTTASDRAVLKAAFSTLSDAKLPAVLMANFDIGRQIDLVVATEHQTLLIEAKGNKTPVRGSSNSAADWSVRNGNGKWSNFRSPVRQADEARLRLRDRLSKFLGFSAPYFPGAVIFAPKIPQGSSIPDGDFKIRTGDLSDLCDWITKKNALPNIELGQWHAFAADLGLRYVSSTAAACDRTLDRAESLVSSYLEKFRDTYQIKAEELISIPCEGTISPKTTLEFAEATAGGESIALIGRSGCGKTLAACRSGIIASERGGVPIFISAKDFEGEFRNLLSREATLLGAPSAEALLGACQRLDRAINLIVNGFNECAKQHQENLVRSISAMSERYGTSIAVTSQTSLPRPELLDLAELHLISISEDTKLTIACNAAIRPLEASVQSLVGAVKTGLEARLIGELQGSIAEPGNRSALFAAPVRYRLGSKQAQAIRLLTLFAKTLSDRLSFSLTVRETDRIAESNDLDPALFSDLERAGLIIRRGERLYFDHEMYLDVFAAEFVIRDANGNPDRILQALRQPQHHERRATIISAIDDHQLQLAVLSETNFSEVFADCLEGSCGSFARQWANQRVKSVIKQMVQEAENLCFEYTAKEFPHFRRTDAFTNRWSAIDVAFIHAIATAFVSGSFVEPVFEIIAKADKRLQSEFQRLQLMIADRKMSIKSQLFELSYVHGSAGPMIGRIAKALHGGFPQPKINAAAEIVSTWKGKAELSYGQIYLLLMLDRIAWEDGPTIADLIPVWLRGTYTSAPYHLKLDLIQSAHFAHGTSNNIREEIIDALQLFSSDQNIFLSSSIVEALASLGALENDESEEASRLREQVRNLLKRGDDEASKQAFIIWNCQFDHPFAGTYCEVISELDAKNHSTFITLACLAAESGTTMFAYPLMIELAATGDHSSGKLLERFLNLPEVNCPFPQDAITEYMGAHICLARFMCALPPERRTGSGSSEIALSAWAEILYWINRLDLPTSVRKSSCRHAMGILLDKNNGNAAAILSEIQRCYLDEGLNRLPGGDIVHPHAKELFRDEIAEICRSCLQNPEIQTGYFAHRDLHEILRFAIAGLGRFGDLTDIPTLQALAQLDVVGSDAIRAIAQLEQRNWPNTT